MSVPDLRAICSRWVHGDMETQLFLTSIYGPFDGTEESIHRWGFDLDYLTRQMNREARWLALGRFDYRKIPGADLARDWWILCVEGVK